MDPVVFVIVWAMLLIGLLTGWLENLIIWFFLLDLYLPISTDPSLDGGVPEWVLRVRGDIS